MILKMSQEKSFGYGVSFKQLQQFIVHAGIITWIGDCLDVGNKKNGA